MPIATPEVYAEMLDKAKRDSFAYPAINVTSSQTLNAALQGFAEAGSDGIVQVSTGGADYLSGPTIKNMVTGSAAFAAYAAEVAKSYPVNIALHTDHCPKDKLDGFVRPLLDISIERVKNGGLPLFQSHMWDGSAVPLDENLQIAQELLEKAAAAHIILEIEVGVVGGEEDGVEGAIDDKLYTTPEDALATVEALGTGEKGRYLTALTFGNVHGVYKPGNVKLRPEILKAAQEAVVEKLGLEAGSRPFDLVFHGGSGSSAEEIGAAVDYGVVKMNVDTDTQYAFTRPVAAHMFTHYDGVLKVDGEVGNKKQYDPRAWGKAAEAGMAARIVEACENLRSAGTVGQRLMTFSDLMAGPAADPPARRPGGGRARRRPAADVVRASPGVAARLGDAGRAGARRRRRRRRHGLRLRPGRLPPQPRPAPPQRLEGARAGAVGARAQPRVPARAGRAGRGRRPDRRGAGGHALRGVPARLQPGGLRRADGLTSDPRTQKAKRRNRPLLRFRRFDVVGRPGPLLESPDGASDRPHP